MATGNIISASDYNNIRNKIIAVMGTTANGGTGTFGYGQGLQSAAVASTAVVTKAQWDALRFDIFNALVHQTGAVPSITSPAAGSVIRFGITHPNNQYDTLADTARNNRFDIGPGRFGTNTLAATEFTDSWISQAYVDFTVTFASADAARYFFNSGGKIRFASSRTGGTTAPTPGFLQNDSWSSLLSSAGTQGFGGQVPDTGFSPLNGRNYYRLTNSFQTFYSLNASGAYTNNRYSLQARCNTVTDNSAGTENIIIFRALFEDLYTDPTQGDPGNPLPNDGVDGTLRVECSELRASGLLQPQPTAGSFTISQPAASFGTFFRS